MAAIQVELFGDKKLTRQFKNLERNMQRKVLTPMTDRVAKKTVRPILQRELPVRSFDPPANWRYRGELGPSHTGPPGVMRAKLKVVAIKRSRVSVGRVVRLPIKEELGIPKDYDFYYPAAIEYGVKFNKFTRRPQPAKRILRTVYQRHEATIQAAVQREARASLKRLMAKS